jgi:hypothetical protein
MASSERIAASLRDVIARLNRRLRQTGPLGELIQAQLSALTSLDLAGALTPRETLWRAVRIVDRIARA